MIFGIRINERPRTPRALRQYPVIAWVDTPASVAAALATAVAGGSGLEAAKAAGVAAGRPCPPGEPVAVLSSEFGVVEVFSPGLEMGWYDPIATVLVSDLIASPDPAADISEAYTNARSAEPN